jgi:hypothetical protein
MDLLDIRANDAPDDAVFAPGFILAVKSADSSMPVAEPVSGARRRINRPINPAD